MPPYKSSSDRRKHYKRVSRSKSWRSIRRVHSHRCYISKVKDRRRRNRKWLQEIKGSLGCVDCGIKDWRVLDFDHRYGKSFCISSRIDYGMGRLLREMEKCDVRCSNCHRIKTLERLHPRCKLQKKVGTGGRCHRRPVKITSSDREISVATRDAQTARRGHPSRVSPSGNRRGETAKHGGACKS